MPDWRKHLDRAIGDEKFEGARLAEVREELAEHLEDRYHAMLAEGMSPGDAEQKLLTELQNGALALELRRVLKLQDAEEPAAGATGGGRFVSSLWRDLRFGFRQLRLSPGFTLAALLSLALGIGANTAIFELLDAVRMRTLPVKNPQELVAVRIVADPHTGMVGHRRGARNLTTNLFKAIGSSQQAFSGFAGWSVDAIDLSESGEAHNGRVLLAGGNLFDVLGIGPALGRLISPPDDQSGCGNPPAVVSYAYWQTELGGSPSVLGKRVWVNRHAFVVAGVAPASFFGLEVGQRFDVVLPLCAQPLINPQDPVYDNDVGWWIGAIGRLKPAWDLRRASAQMGSLSPSLMQATVSPRLNSSQHKDYLEMKLGAVPAATGYSSLRQDYDRPFWMLLGIASLVLLIACANLANLMLARATARDREMAVRLALGASRVRLLRQLLAEGLLLATLGAAAGVILARTLSRALVPFLGPESSHIFLELHLDWRVLGFTAGLALITCILFGLSPALHASGVAPAEAMKSGRAVVASRSGMGLRRALVAVQIAFCMTLVVAALLFVRTFRNLLTEYPGFDPNGILVVQADFSRIKMPPEQRVLFRQHLTEVLAGIPGVESAARSIFEPMNGGQWNDQINIPQAGTSRQWAWIDTVSAGYFKTVKTPLIAGRDFREQDTGGSSLVAIISEAFARKLFHEPNPVGKTFGQVQYGDKPDVIYQVVGIVRDTKFKDLRSDFEPVVYLPDTQPPDFFSYTMLLVRSRQPADILLPEIRHELLKINPDLVLQFSRLKDDMADTLVAERLMAMLAGFFGVLAIVLAIVGLYGVIAYMVARRTSEIGIRMALGAQRSAIVVLILKEVAVICCLGLMAGLGLAIAAGPAARSLLFGLTPTDPTTLALAVIAVAAVAATASMLPALRAAQLDPMVALHEE